MAPCIPIKKPWYLTHTVRFYHFSLMSEIFYFYAFIDLDLPLLYPRFRRWTWIHFDPVTFMDGSVFQFEPSILFISTLSELFQICTYVLKFMIWIMASLIPIASKWSDKYLHCFALKLQSWLTIHIMLSFFVWCRSES